MCIDTYEFIYIQVYINFKYITINYKYIQINHKWILYANICIYYLTIDLLVLPDSFPFCIPHSLPIHEIYVNNLVHIICIFPMHIQPCTSIYIHIYIYSLIIIYTFTYMWGFVMNLHKLFLLYPNLFNFLPHLLVNHGNTPKIRKIIPLVDEQ